MAIEHPPVTVTLRDDNPGAIARAGVYEQALELTMLVDQLVEKVEARFHLKERLDRTVVVLTLHIAQAAGETSKALRRRQYQTARRAATDCAAILDIIGRRPGVVADLLAPARASIIRLISQLALLATR